MAGQTNAWFKQWWGILIIALSALLLLGVLGKVFVDARHSSEVAAAKAAERRETAKADAEMRHMHRDKSGYEAVPESDFSSLLSDPGAYEGMKYVVYGRVTKAAAAGGSQISADVAPTRGESAGDYRVHARVTTKDPNNFKGLAENDLVTIYAEVGGSSDAEDGDGTGTPSFDAYVVEKTGSAG